MDLGIVNVQVLVPARSPCGRGLAPIHTVGKSDPSLTILAQNNRGILDTTFRSAILISLGVTAGLWLDKHTHNAVLVLASKANAVVINQYIIVVVEKRLPILS